MRDTVMIKLGGSEYPLLPAFEVADQFEDRTKTGILEHLSRLSSGTALMRDRAVLVMLAAQAADKDSRWDLDATMKRMFEAGIWDTDQVMIEIELVEKLLYTPEQYLRKKEERAEEIEAMSGLFGNISNSFSESQPST